MMHNPFDDMPTVDEVKPRGVDIPSLALELHHAAYLASFDKLTDEFERILRLHLARNAPLPGSFLEFSREIRDDAAAGFQPSNLYPGKWEECDVRFRERIKIATNIRNARARITGEKPSIYRSKLIDDLALSIEHYTLSHELNAAGIGLGVPRPEMMPDDEQYRRMLFAHVVGL